MRILADEMYTDPLTTLRELLAEDKRAGLPFEDVFVPRLLSTCTGSTLDAVWETLEAWEDAYNDRPTPLQRFTPALLIDPEAGVRALVSDPGDDD